MPLSTQEVKNLLKEVFRLVIALNKDDQTQALSAFSSILDTALVETDEYADMPPLVAAVKKEARYDMPDLESVNEHVTPANWKLPTASAQPDDDVRLIITETEQPKEELSVIDPDDEGVEAVALNDDGIPEEEEAGVEAVALNDDGIPEEEEAGEEPGEEEEAEEEEEAGEEEAEAGEEEDVEEDVEEEAVELDLEPVRIRKVIYWKDAATGDLYQYLPDDEVGDKVGSYVNGVPMFE